MAGCILDRLEVAAIGIPQSAPTPAKSPLAIPPLGLLCSTGVAQMLESPFGIVEQHARACVAHGLTDALAHLGRKAVGLA